LEADFYFSYTPDSPFKISLFNFSDLLNELLEYGTLEVVENGYFFSGYPVFVFGSLIELQFINLIIGLP
jgi:hypothetical protein